MMTWMSLALASLLCACASHSSTDPKPIPPHRVAAEVVAAVEHAAATDTEDAQAVWAAAHHRFERELEPLLRQRYSHREVAEVEYRFGMVRAQMTSGSASEAARELGAVLASLCADLQPTAQ